MTEQAFPQNTVYLASNGQSVQQGPQGGMTLRDYFAAKAMQGYLQIPEVMEAISKEKLTPFKICEGAYSWADTMLKARKA